MRFHFSFHKNHAYKEYKITCGLSGVRALNVFGICTVTILHIAYRALLLVIKRLRS